MPRPEQRKLLRSFRGTRKFKMRIPQQFIFIYSRKPESIDPYKQAQLFNSNIHPVSKIIKRSELPVKIPVLNNALGGALFQFFEIAKSQVYVFAFYGIMK